jgi:heme/copper-type cytochrome/quinol oxidase subunit 3
MTDLAVVDRPLGPFAGKSLGWWGVIVAIATEATLFALLLFSYFYLWAQNDHWPLGDIEEPKLLKVSIRSVLLIGSSIPAQLAERALRRGRTRAFIAHLVVTVLLAAVFLAGHVDDTIKDWKEFRPSTNAYGSLFYTIVNLHALHLVIGIAFLLFVLLRGINGRYGPDRMTEVEVVVLYWHFVDAVWIAVFSSLYLAVNFA